MLLTLMHGASLHQGQMKLESDSLSPVRSYGYDH